MAEIRTQGESVGARSPSGSWALVVDGGGGGSRSALATVRALATAGHQVVTAVSNEVDIAASSRATTALAVVAPVQKVDDFVRDVRSAAKRYNNALTFATSDAALIALDMPGADLVDKTLLAERAEASGVRVPIGTVFANGDEASRATSSFPVVAKPVVGSVPAIRIESPEGFASVDATSGPIIVQPFLEGEMRAVSGVIWDGQLRAVIHQRYLRTWPADCGTASAAITTEADLEIEASLPALLDGHQGIFQLQFIGSYLIDINPRPYGSMPLALGAGVNLPALVIQLSTDTAPRSVQRARPGVRYRWIEGDLRHLFGSLRADLASLRSIADALRPRPMTAHSVVELRDPRPTLMRLRRAASRSKTQT